MRLLIALLSALCWASPVAGQIGGPCEICHLMYEGMPKNIPWETAIAGASEPGEQLIVRGRVFERDGKTPAEGVILYVYQTNAEGRYAPAPDQKHGRRHGQLRGWVKTNRNGEYMFRTIKPASYPNSSVESHIHAVLKEPDKQEYYISDFLFDDDPHLSAEHRRNQEKRGGNGILSPEKNADGVLVATRNIILGLNIPGYPKQ